MRNRRRSVAAGRRPAARAGTADAQRTARRSPPCARGFAARITPAGRCGATSRQRIAAWPRHRRRCVTPSRGGAGAAGRAHGAAGPVRLPDGGRTTRPAGTGSAGTGPAGTGPAGTGSAGTGSAGTRPTEQGQQGQAQPGQLGQGQRNALGEAVRELDRQRLSERMRDRRARRAPGGSAERRSQSRAKDRHGQQNPRSGLGPQGQQAQQAQQGQASSDGQRASAQEGQAIARDLDRLAERLGAANGQGGESDQLSEQLSRIRELREQRRSSSASCPKLSKKRRPGGRGTGGNSKVRRTGGARARRRATATIRPGTARATFSTTCVALSNTKRLPPTSSIREVGTWHRGLEAGFRAMGRAESAAGCRARTRREQHGGAAAEPAGHRSPERRRCARRSRTIPPARGSVLPRARVEETGSIAAADGASGRDWSTTGSSSQSADSTVGPRLED